MTRASKTKAVPVQRRLEPMRLWRAVWVGLLVSLTIISGTMLHGQDNFPTPPNTEPISEASRLSPKDAAEQLRMPVGFEVQVFAAEPIVQNPIAMTWDGQGRLWVAENYTYADRTQRFDLSLRDRVLILEDTDGDGRCDQRHVFTDDVQMLTGIEIGHGGVWLMCPPKLLFIPDRDRDDQPDGPAEVVLDGFEVAQANYHNFANGLRFGPDGWLYGRCGGSCPGNIGVPGTPDAQRYPLEGGIWRYHPSTRNVEVLVAGTTNPWGHDWNELGELFFINTVNGHFWQMIPGAHYMRPFTLDPNPSVYEMLDHHADHWHFDTGQGWTASRDGAANDLGGGHAHVGGMIYLGTNWPDRYRGNFFTFNIHGQRANQEIISREGSGFVARHGEDIAISNDPWFRGMELTYGPDGSVYMADWSDAGECHEHTGVHRTSGRIFRVRYQTSAAAQQLTMPQANLYDLDREALLNAVPSSNEWWSRQARVEIAYRASHGDEADRRAWCEQLQTRLGSTETTSERLRYLWTLHTLDGLTAQQLTKLMHDPQESIRVWAIRMVADGWPIDDVLAELPIPPARQAVEDQVQTWLPTFCELAQSDSSGWVLLTLASTLQRMPLNERVELAQVLTRRAEFANDHNLPLMVWYGMLRVADQSPNRLLDVARECRWPKTQRFIARRITEQLETHPSLVDRLIRWAADLESAAEQENVLTGIHTGLEGWRTAKAPDGWSQLVQDVQHRGTDSSRDMVRSLSVLFGGGRALAEVRSIVLDEDRDVNERRSALEALVNQRPADLPEFCRPLLRDPRLNMTAARGLAQIDDPNVADLLIDSYRFFRAPNRPRVISILVSRESFVTRLLDAIESNRLSVEQISAYDVRQIHSLESESLSERIGQLWGEVRDTDEARQQLIKQIAIEVETSRQKQQPVDLVAGRKLFKETASAMLIPRSPSAVAPTLNLSAEMARHDRMAPFRWGHDSRLFRFARAPVAAGGD